MAAKCKRCWGCTCNWSCTCTMKQRLEDIRANVPEYQDVDFSQFKWLSQKEAIKKFLEVTWKDYVSNRDLVLLGYKI